MKKMMLIGLFLAFSQNFVTCSEGNNFPGRPFFSAEQIQELSKMFRMAAGGGSEEMEYSSRVTSLRVELQATLLEVKSDTLASNQLIAKLTQIFAKAMRTQADASPHWTAECTQIAAEALAQLNALDQQQQVRATFNQYPNSFAKR